MKFYQRRGVALVVLILAILGASVYGISRRPASLPEVEYYNWIADEAGLLSEATEDTIQSYNTAWNDKYYAVVAVAAVGAVASVLLSGTHMPLSTIKPVLHSGRK